MWHQNIVCMYVAMYIYMYVYIYILYVLVAIVGFGVTTATAMYETKTVW